MKLSEVKKIEFISSGIGEIDELVGGLPRGRITEIVGAEGIGKSYLMTKMAAAATQAGMSVFLLDAEQAANKERMEALGVKLELVDYSSVYELETASNEVLEAIKTHDLVIIDSIATLKPKNILDGELGEANIGLVLPLHGEVRRQAQTSRRRVQLRGAVRQPV
jgi:recombination protein RecA